MGEIRVMDKVSSVIKKAIDFLLDKGRIAVEMQNESVSVYSAVTRICLDSDNIEFYRDAADALPVINLNTGVRNTICRNIALEEGIEYEFSCGDNVVRLLFFEI